MSRKEAVAELWEIRELIALLFACLGIFAAGVWLLISSLLPLAISFSIALGGGGLIVVNVLILRRWWKWESEKVRESVIFLAVEVFIAVLFLASMTTSVLDVVGITNFFEE